MSFTLPLKGQNADLGKLLRLPSNTHIVWSVVQDERADRATLAKSERELEEEIKAAEEGSRRQRELMGILRFIRKTPDIERTDVEFDLQYVSKTRYRLAQIFPHPPDKSVVDYFAGSGGLLYTIESQMKQIRISDEPALMLANLVRGYPGLALSSIPSYEKLAVVEDTAESTVLGRGDAGESQCIVVIPKETGIPSKIEVNHHGKTTLDITVSPARFPGTDLPATVTFTEYSPHTGEAHFRQVWTVKSVAPIVDPSAVEMRYKLQPGFHVSSSIRGVTREATSDELIEEAKEGQE